jgi:hypothetical protein
MYNVAFPQRSNRASWVYVGEITDLSDNPIDLTATPLVFQIADKRGYGVLEASTDNGKITIIGPGLFRVFFSVQDMRTLRLGTYNTGLTLTSSDGTQTEQLAIGPLPIVDGIVP